MEKQLKNNKSYSLLRLYYLDSILNFLNSEEKFKLATGFMNKKIFSYYSLSFYRYEYNHIN